MPCDFLPWDSDFFGVRIARIKAHRLDPQRMQAILEWCDSQQIACLYFLADSDHGETVRLAEDHGFRQVDIRLTLQHNLASGEMRPLPDGLHIRPSQPDDIPMLKALAGSSFQNSRYYYDPCFPDSICDTFYETWIERSCQDYADAVLVAVDDESALIGYISCHLSPDRMGGTIGLVGVAASAQGRGIGRILVQQALNWFAGAGAQTVQVVTQGRNIAGQRLYQRGGFVTHQVQLWYHKWFIDCE